MIEEPVAASLGAGLPIDAPTRVHGGRHRRRHHRHRRAGRGNVIQARSLRVAGNAMDEAIMRYVRRRHHLVIGEANAERIKIEAGTALAQPNGRAGGDPHQGPRPARGASQERGAGSAGHGRGAVGLHRRHGRVHPAGARGPAAEAAQQVTKWGIMLTGGGALLDRLDVALAQRTGAKFLVPDTPMHCVIRGSAAMLETLPEREHLLISP